MKKIPSLFFTLLLFFGSIPFVSAESKSVCDVGVDQKIQEVRTRYQGALGELLRAKEKKSTLTTEMSNQLRTFYCEMDTICQFAEYVYLKQEDIQKKDFIPPTFTCLNYDKKSFFKTYPLEDYKGKKSLCAYSKDPEEYARIKASCRNKTTLQIENAELQVKTEFSLASKQDQANYYSAKLLSIANRLENMSDSLQQLNREIRRSFESIFCRCP